MVADSPSKFLDQLRVLSDHGVSYVIVGGVAALLEGAPIMTFDLDIVFERESSNVERLVNALQALDARYKDPGGRRIIPNAERLTQNRLNLLMTSSGGLDVLATIGENLAYEDLLGQSHLMEVEGMRLRVLNLETLIASKEFAGREKDLAALPILRRTLQLKKA